MTRQTRAETDPPDSGDSTVKRVLAVVHRSAAEGADLFTQGRAIARLEREIAPHPQGEPMITHQNIAEWRGKELVDREGAKIGKLEDVYVDVETDEPIFGTVKEGLIGRHLTFVPLGGLTIGPDNLQVPVSSDQVKGAPELALDGEELSSAEESTLYHHYELNYTTPANESGRRLARR